MTVTTARGGYTRGTKPARPGDLTARKYNEDIRRTEADRKTRENPVDISAVRLESFRAGYDTGHEAGRRAGIEAYADVLYRLYKDEGIESVQELLSEMDASEDDDPGEAE